MARAMDEDELIAYFEDLVILDHCANDEEVSTASPDRQKSASPFESERLINAVANALRVHGVEIGLVDTPNGQAIKIIELK